VETRTITKDDLCKLISAEIDGGAVVYAPVAEGDCVDFKAIGDVGRICWDFGNTRLSPKSVFFPRSEVLFRGKCVDGGVELEEALDDAPPAVLFGVRPCDAGSLAALDKLFGWDYEDKFYQARRQATCVIGMGCVEPQPRCFCTSVGGSPLSRAGSDILLIPLGGDRFAVEVCSEKGGELAARHEALLGPTPEELPSEEDVIGKMARHAPLTEAKEKLDRNFEDPLWEQLTRACIGCGLCAFVCPSCYCFDIVDEPVPVGQFERRRNWDSCCFGVYSLHASGHNPRPTQERRYRNRAMHKFSYFPERFGMVKCSGCGRCGAQCPVNLDIFEVVKAFLEKD